MNYLVFGFIGVLGLIARRMQPQNIKWLAIVGGLANSLGRIINGINNDILKENTVVGILALLVFVAVNILVVYLWFKLLNYFEESLVISIIIFIIGIFLTSLI